MVAMMIVSAAVVAQASSQTHVRTNEPRIVTLIHAGLERSATFRHLVETLNQSDVIVYIEPKLTRHTLGGFLQNDVVAQGGYRYLRVAIDMQGVEKRLVPVLAHELQHAVEVARDPSATNAQSIETLFARLAITFGCNGSGCSETKEATDVEMIVRREINSPR